MLIAKFEPGPLTVEAATLPTVPNQRRGGFPFYFYIAALLMLNKQQMYLFSQIQSSQTGGQPSSDTSPYEVKLYYLDKPVKQEVSHPSLVWHSGQIGRFQNQRTRV